MNPLVDEIPVRGRVAERTSGTLAVHRLADDLQEEVGQDIAGTSLLVAAAAKRAAALDPTLAGELRRISALLNDAVEKCALVGDVRDEAAGTRRHPARMIAGANPERRDEPLADAMSRELLRLGQEALASAVRQAHDQAADPSLWQNGATVVACVSGDDGSRVVCELSLPERRPA